MAGKRSKSKGKRGEAEAAAKLSRITKAHWERDGIEQDISCDKKTRLHVEVKYRERLNIYEAIHQAIDDAKKKGAVPSVMHRKNRESWLVTVPLESLVDFSRELIKLIDGK